MIGELQWAISLGRFDILKAVMNISQYRIAPREGHLHRLKHIYGYLKRFKSGVIRVCTDIPDFSCLSMLSIIGNTVFMVMLKN
jgi:hypothetical protein